MPALASLSSTLAEQAPVGWASCALANMHPIVDGVVGFLVIELAGDNVVEFAVI